MSVRVLAGAAFLQLLGATWRVARGGTANVDAARAASPRGNVIFAFWHGSLLMLAYTHRNRDIQVLVSQHRDGGWIAGILAHMGYGLVRGSSRRGGVEALFRLATVLEEGHDIAVTVDGPVGPRYSVHPGVALLARRTRRPIVPVTASFARGTFLGTWDALRVPAPGTRVAVAYEPAIWVPETDPEASVARTQATLETALLAATRREEARCGRTIELIDIQDRRPRWERWSESQTPPGWLRAASHVYGTGVRVERALRPRPPGRGVRPWVIGIGNLEAGGTGKTPILALIATALADSGLAVAILTRGHGGTLGRPPAFVDAAALARASDETRWLAAQLGSRVPICVARDKAAGLARLSQRESLDVVVVDDAFQTANLPVDRHLVLLDWAQPWGNGWLLPAGRLRERPRALARADALLFTRAGGAPPELEARITGAVPRFAAVETDAGLCTPTGRRVEPESLGGEGVALLCGIGRPRAFERLAESLAARHGFAIRRRVRIGDHAALEPALRRLASRLEALECTRIVITAKDAARLHPGHEWNEPLLVLEQRLVVPDLASILECLGPQFSSSP